MRENLGISKLCEIYQELDAENKEKMVQAVIKMFCVPKTPENKQVQPKVSYSSSRRFIGIPIPLLMGFPLLFSACLFWIILINPALLMHEGTPLIILRIIITALFGMSIIGAGILQFILRKFTVPWMILAIGAGILCVDPAVHTDIVGYALIALIIAAQVIKEKRKKTAIAV